jgi:predicted Zn-dependent protease
MAVTSRITLRAAALVFLLLAAPPAAASQPPSGPPTGEAERAWATAMRLYEQDDYAGAAAAFETVTALRPSEGTAWAMRGLCEYRLGRMDAALAHIRKGRALGLPDDPQLRQVVQYHEGVLLAGAGEFERAQDTLAALAASGVDSEEVTLALGCAVLRVPPADLPGADDAVRRAVVRAGHAERLAARKQLDQARAAYQALAADFPGVRHASYALGRHFVAVREPDKAVEAYAREIEAFPDHVPARLGIAAIKAASDPAGALRLAEQAVALNPRVPLGHFLLGSLLLHTPDTDRAIRELEIAEQSVREDPRLYYALSRAYARAGRRDDAARARATFLRLTEEQQRAGRRVQ